MANIGAELVMEFESEQQKMLLNLLFTSNWLKHMDAEDLRPHGLSPQQYNILRVLRGAKGRKMSMREVLQRMLDRSPNATRLTDKLIAKGLVLRTRCTDDRRVVHLQISPAGRALVDSMDQGREKMIRRVARKLTDAEILTMNTLLDKLRS